jgi:hypothetical protein
MTPDTVTNWRPRVGQAVRIRGGARGGTVMLLREVDETVYVDVELRDPPNLIRLGDLLERGWRWGTYTADELEPGD